MTQLTRLCTALAGTAALALSGPLFAQAQEVSLTNFDPLPYVEKNQLLTGQCKKDMCASLQVRTVEFADYSAFSTQVTQKLLGMANYLEDKPAKFETVPELVTYFEQNAYPMTQELLQTDVMRSRNNLVVVNLVHYLDTGGAHGETTSDYVNWIPGSAQWASLETMLQPGAKPKYEAALKQAHEKWLEEQLRSNNIENIQDFTQTWPFIVSDNVALMPEGLKVTYQRYDIGPGSFGQPSLTLPYSQLGGILKPEYIQVARD